MRILLVAERSGGHFFPALSLAHQIKRESFIHRSRDTVTFFVTSPTFKQIVKKKRFAVFGKVFGFRNLVLEGTYRFLEAPLLLLWIRPHRVVGFGGRDSFFLLLWARLFFVETAIYEPNLLLGKTNKFLLHCVNKVFCGFKETTYPIKKAIFAGIPVRTSFKKMNPEEAKARLGLDGTKKVITAIGGSQGSTFINKIFKECVQRAGNQAHYIHLTGEKEYEEISLFYSKIGVKAFIKEFWEAMHIVYSASDVVIARSGALTLAEIIFFQIPAIFIPYPEASEHQYTNAAYLKERGSAFLFPQERFRFDDFWQTVQAILHHDDIVKHLRGNLKKINVVVGADAFYKTFFTAE